MTKEEILAEYEKLVNGEETEYDDSSLLDEAIEFIKTLP